MKAKKSAKKRVTLHEHRYSESACTSQVLAKGKGKQTPSWPLIPQATGTCSLSSLEAPKGAIFASSGRDRTLLDRERRPRSCTGREARKDGFDRFRALSFLGGCCLSPYAAHCLHFSVISRGARHGLWRKLLLGNLLVLYLYIERCFSRPQVAQGTVVPWRVMRLFSESRRGFQPLLE